MGWLDAIRSVFSWVGGESFGAALVRIAIGLGISKYLQDQNKQDNTSSTPQGQRQQIQPATDNKIPVVYGDAYLSGTIVDVQLSNANKEMFAVLALSETTGNLFSNGAASDIIIDDVYISNNRVTFKADGTTVDYTTDATGVVDNNLSALVGIYLYKGNSNSPMLPCTTGTRTAMSGTVPPVAYSIMPGWDNTYLMENVVFAVVKMNYDPQKGTHSIPALKFHVRNTITQPGDVLYDYMVNDLYGAGLSPTIIDTASLTALNTYSAQSVTLGTYAAQPRYTTNGLIRTTENVMANIQRITENAGSYMSYDVTSGKWSVIIQKVGTKAVDFNDSNIIGQIGLVSTNLDAYYNQLEVQFPYAYLKDQMNFVHVDLPLADWGPNESSNKSNLTAELCNNVVQATIIGNLNIRQSREDQVITFTTDYSKYNVQIGDIIGVTNAVYGFSSKLFRVIRVKRTESDVGQLTVDITAQSYASTVYDVTDISTFVPSIGYGHSLPSLAPIATPAAPTITTSTLSSQPSITIHGVVPGGVVNDMEFWYTKDTTTDDNARNYTLLGSMRATNSGPFTTGDTPAFKTVLLSSGTYYFKVRGVNASGSSKYSPPSAATPYTYVQAPDVLTYQTPVVDGTTGAAVGGMSMGLMAGYLATKLNWFGANGILSGTGNLSSIFGLSTTEANIVSNAAAAATTYANVTPGFSTVKAGNTVGSTSNILSSNGSTISFIAGPGTSDGAKIFITTNPGTNTVTIDLIDPDVAGNTSGNTSGNTGNGGGNTGNTVTSYTSSLAGTSFPMVFGSGPTDGAVDSRAGIFTHDYMVFSGSSHGGLVRSQNIITSSKALQLSANGILRDFYDFPSLTSGSWSRKPWYDETITDKYNYDSKVSIYYSTATYTSGNLDAQSWSPWTLCGSNDGVTGFNGNVVITVPAVAATPSTYANTWSNPQPTIVSTIVDAPYFVEEVKANNYTSNSFPAAYTDSLATYDPFKANTLVVVQISPGTAGTASYTYNEVHSDLSKATSVATGNTSTTITFAGGANDLIMFGVSVFNPPTSTAVNNNTVFGHATPHFINTYPDSRAFKQVANNGSRFVGISATDDWVFWSDDGMLWTRVKKQSDVTAIWSAPTTFEFVLYAGTMFFVFDAQNGSASSTDGKIWTEYTVSQSIDPLTRQVDYGGGLFVAVGANGWQSSTDGITFTSPVSLGPNLYTVVYDGSQWLVGSKYANSYGSALYTSTDGATWVANPVQSDPNALQSMSTSDYLTSASSLALANGMSVGTLP